MDGRTMAWLSYITPIGWVIAFLNYNNSLVKLPLTAFHLRQSLGLMAIYIACWFFATIMLLSITFLAFIFYLIYIGLSILWVIGLIHAVNGEQKELPLVGRYFQQWFTFLK